MVIVSSCVVLGRNERHLSYRIFKEKAFSQEGLDIDDVLMLNIHDVEQDVYQECVSVPQIGFFSLTGTCPGWCDTSKIQDWSMYQKGEPTEFVIGGNTVQGFVPGAQQVASGNAQQPQQAQMQQNPVQSVAYQAPGAAPSIPIPQQDYGTGQQQYTVAEPQAFDREAIRSGGAAPQQQAQMQNTVPNMQMPGVPQQVVMPPQAPGIPTQQIAPNQQPGMQQPMQRQQAGMYQNPAGQDLDDAEREVTNLLSDSVGDAGCRGGKVYVFGSSKGGTGKTFTAIISTYRYAKTHPHQKIALVDFDIIDGQVGISIHRVKPTIRKYFSEYQKGYRDFRTMHEFCVHAREPFPQNVDFYLAPSNNARINDDAFWLNVIKNCIENYDMVVFDTGIDYINLRPISYVYKCADKILLITTTSIKSVNSVTKQIGRLKGEIPSKDDQGHDVFTEQDEIAKRLHVVITQMLPTNEMNRTIYNTLAAKAPVAATFGVITDSVSRAEFFGEWSIFDKNSGVLSALDKIMS